jgi:hypothetical protein
MNAKELDDYLFVLKSEITNLRTLNDNLKSQVAKLENENSSLENFIRTKKMISSVIYENYRNIITKFENL